ncbi:helix-turn-helix domain-containing protein [Lentibacillus salicampi]|nr:helix-turn-helix transcriptional regulator [Lentibacillus salicampi]
MQFTEKEMFKMQRQKLGIKLAEVAKYAKCDPSYLSKYEKGKYEPSPKIINAYKEYIANYQ